MQFLKRLLVNTIIIVLGFLVLLCAISFVEWNLGVFKFTYNQLFKAEFLRASLIVYLVSILAIELGHNPKV